MGRQAITTKYLGPTDHHGSRIKATCQARSLYTEWDDALSSDANHWQAAFNLAKRMGWVGQWYEANLPNGQRVYSTADLIAFTLGAE